MAEGLKRIVVPLISVDHNADVTGLEARVDLAGAPKESIDLNVGGIILMIHPSITLTGPEIIQALHRGTDLNVRRFLNWELRWKRLHHLISPVHSLSD